jgi:hypothetical protein
MARSENGEVRAVHSAQIAAAALLGRDYLRGMVTLGIKRRSQRQDVSGAEFYTEATALTSLYGNGNKAFGHEVPSSKIALALFARLLPNRNNQVLIEG